MKKWFEETLMELAASFGLLIERARMSSDQVHQLISLVKPKSVGVDLIRVGPDTDGGYLVPNDLDEIEALFSPGVGPVSFFEADCADRGMKIYMADASVDGPAHDDDRFSFLPKFLSIVDADEFITLDSWVNNSNVSKGSDLMLQMDIEGFEFQVLSSISDDLLNRFRIIVIEFHKLNRVWSREYYNQLYAVMKRLSESHTCVHIHPNNITGIEKVKGVSIPRVAEFTFYRNDRFDRIEGPAEIPHPLDVDNDPTIGSVALANEWIY